jgi:hypothetical protein
VVCPAVSVEATVGTPAAVDTTEVSDDGMLELNEPKKDIVPIVASDLNLE